MKEHWDRIYTRKEPENLGWYEEYPAQSMDLIRQCGLANQSRILCAGAGTSGLIEALLDEGYSNIIANDLSKVALDKLKSGLRVKDKYNIQYIVDDLTDPVGLKQLDLLDLWFDRAVLHFFLTAEQQDAYFGLLNNLVRTGGYAIIAAFNLNGAETCSGLPVHRYNANMLQERIGSDFDLLQSFDHIHKMPNGEERPYVYTLFRKE